MYTFYVHIDSHNFLMTGFTHTVSIKRFGITVVSSVLEDQMEIYGI
jgi:hypothetical protein